jgi:hypothetical protein
MSTNNHSPTSVTSSLLARRASIALANKNQSLKNYIQNVRKKHAEDKDYAKWDLTVSQTQF